MSQRFLDALNTELITLGGTKVTVTTIATFASVLVISWGVSRGLQAALRGAMQQRGVHDRPSVDVTARLLHYAVVFVGFGVALQIAGINLGSLFTAGAVFAVGIGFAMQNITQNFVAGVILLAERSITPGDVLELDGRVVRVLELRVRTTLVRTRDYEELIVPNSLLAQTSVKNYTMHDSLYRLRVVVGVAYGSDMALVRSTLEEVASAMPWPREDRTPHVLMVDFGSSSVDYEVAVWTDDPWLARARLSDIREAIWVAFEEKGIAIAFPQCDVHFDPPVVEALGAVRTAA